MQCALESYLKQLNLYTGLHVVLDLWSLLNPGFIHLLENLQVLKSLAHLQQRQLQISIRS